MTLDLVLRNTWHYVIIRLTENFDFLNLSYVISYEAALRKGVNLVLRNTWHYVIIAGAENVDFLNLSYRCSYEALFSTQRCDHGIRGC